MIHLSTANPARRWQQQFTAVLPLLMASLAACAQAQSETLGERADARDGGRVAVVAFVDVSVVPMDAERVLGGHTVIVEGDRITAVGPVADTPVPAGATRVDGAGHYLMPGLAEMHGHIPGNDRQYAEDVLFLYVSNGVTLVRGMAGHPTHLELRDAVARGDLLGPVIHAAGPGFGGNVRTAEAAERLAREQAAAGYDLFKVAGPSADAYEALARTAHELGVPFAGHIPADVGIDGAIAARQASVDHLDRYVEYMAAGPAAEGRDPGFFGSGVVDLVDTSRMPEIVAATRDAGVWNVPTLSLVEHLASAEPPEQMIQWPEMRYMPRGVRDGWVQAKHTWSARADFQPAAANRLVELRRQLLKALHDAGAPIALGSDAPQFFNVPGFSIHHEMAMMVAAGLSPYEVLVTGTRNPAVYFGTPDDFGTVAVGRRADLILLAANPLEDIGNVRDPAGVMAGGRWLPAAEIRERLDDIAARVNRGN